MAHNLDPIAQYRIVHDGIREVAARCDGARSLDLKGFDGQDTHYGRRIAGVPFEKLTADDHVEIARIANKYRDQIERYTGVVVADLEVVQAAKDSTTNYASRQNARRYEKLSAVQAARKVTLLADGRVGVSWASKGDPDFDALLTGVRQLQGRRYNPATKTNEVDATDALLAFANEHDMEVPAEVIAAIEGRKAVIAQAAQVEAQKPQVALDRDGLLVVSNKVTEDAEVRALVMRLPGRRWNGQNNVVPATPEAAALFAKLGLRLSDNATAALGTVDGPVEAGGPSPITRATLLSQASRAGSINDLPAEFITLIRQATGA
jgi:hypothetical protein